MEVPQTPAGNQLRWYLEVTASDMSRLTVAEANAHMEPPLTLSDEELRADWTGLARRLGQYRISAIERDEPLEIVLAIEADKGTRYQLNLTVASDPPHKIDRRDWERLYDFEVVVREATPEDGPVLADIERRAPIVMGDSLLTFDRSADYLAAARLMEDSTVVMAEVDGAPAAVEWAACHRACIGGTEYRLVNYIHLRVAAEHQRKGLWGALVQKLNEHYPPEIKIDSGYQCAASSNASIQKAFEGTPSWSVGPIRALLSATEQAAPSCGRVASSREAELIVELLNHTHGNEEMYFPYSVESLRARLERAPELYSWDQVWLTDSAVVGVWPAANQTTVIAEAGGKITKSRHGLVLDYGFRAGAEEEFKDLLGAWCAWLAQNNHSHISIFTSEPSVGYNIVQAMAEHLEPFDIWTPPIPEPKGVELNGVYMDQVYF